MKLNTAIQFLNRIKYKYYLDEMSNQSFCIGLHDIRKYLKRYQSNLWNRYKNKIINESYEDLLKDLEKLNKEFII